MDEDSLKWHCEDFPYQPFPQLPTPHTLWEALTVCDAGDQAQGVIHVRQAHSATQATALAPISLSRIQEGDWF